MKRSSRAMCCVPPKEQQTWCPNCAAELKRRCEKLRQIRAPAHQSDQTVSSRPLPVLVPRSDIEDYRSQLATICANMRSAEHSRPSVVRESWDEHPTSDANAEGGLHDDAAAFPAPSTASLLFGGDAMADSSSVQASFLAKPRTRWASAADFTFVSRQALLPAQQMLTFQLPPDNDEEAIRASHPIQVLFQVSCIFICNRIVNLNTHIQIHVRVHTCVKIRTHTHIYIYI